MNSTEPGKFPNRFVESKLRSIRESMRKGCSCEESATMLLAENSYLEQTFSKIAFDNSGMLTYWTLSDAGLGGAIREGRIIRACSAHGGLWPQPNGNADCIPIFLHKCKEVTDREPIDSHYRFS
jgi:hypothetical protein